VVHGEARARAWACGCPQPKHISTVGCHLPYVAFSSKLRVVSILSSRVSILKIIVLIVLL
jgi:hypothetical protein